MRGILWQLHWCSSEKHKIKERPCNRVTYRRNLWSTNSTQRTIREVLAQEALSEPSQFSKRIQGEANQYYSEQLRSCSGRTGTSGRRWAREHQRAGGNRPTDRHLHNGLLTDFKVELNRTRRASQLIHAEASVTLVVMSRWSATVFVGYAWSYTRTKTCSAEHGTQRTSWNGGSGRNGGRIMCFQRSDRSLEYERSSVRPHVIFSI